MNYLVHLYLSDPEPEVRLGNLLGDWVKGPLDPGAWPPGVLRGLRQHRALDSFCVSCEPVRQSRRRIHARFGHWRAVLVDIFYDHLLAADWHNHHTRPLTAFAADCYRLFDLYHDILPTEFRPVAARMRTHDWLSSYADPATVPLVLGRMAERVRRPNPLAAGAGELKRHRNELQTDMRRFLHLARAFLNA